MRGRVITCADCGDERKHRARGLCFRCYDRHRQRGTLANFSPTKWAYSDYLAEWEHYAYDHTLTYNANLRRFAEWIGKTYAATERALRVAGVKAGDR